jgi:hypothetical protein
LISIFELCSISLVEEEEIGIACSMQGEEEEEEKKKKKNPYKILVGKPLGIHRWEDNIKMDPVGKWLEWLSDL